jgi:ADP-dependent phosphofructokinase/glucokinase
LRPFQGLDRRLFIDVENDRFGGRVHIKADDLGGLRRKVRIVALAPGFAGRQIDLVMPQATPDIIKNPRSKLRGIGGARSEQA